MKRCKNENYAEVSNLINCKGEKSYGMNFQVMYIQTILSNEFNIKKNQRCIFSGNKKQGIQLAYALTKHTF
jgi:hypothetical protein